MTSKANQKIVTLILLILIFISSYYFFKLYQNRQTLNKIPDIKYGYLNNTDNKPIKKIFQQKNDTAQPTAQSNSSIAPEPAKTQLIDINQADKESLITLPGIGDVLASRIIEYREANGKFKSNKELKKVSGIGDKKFNAILPKLQPDKKTIHSQTRTNNSPGKNTSSDKSYCENCNAELIPDNNRRKTIKPYCRKCLKYIGK